MRRLILIILAGMLAWALLAVAALQGFKRAADSEIQGEILILERANKIHPAVGALDPILEKADRGLGYYLVIDADGNRVGGNIVAIKQGPPPGNNPELLRFSVSTPSGNRDMYGRWLQLDGAFWVLLARSPRSLYMLLLISSLITISVAVLSGAASWHFAKKREKHDNDRVHAMTTILQDYARGDEASHLPEDMGKGPLRQLGDEFRRTQGRINAHIGMFEYLDGFFRHDVLGPLQSAYSAANDAKDVEAKVRRLSFLIEDSLVKAKGILRVAAFEIGGRSELDEVDLATLVQSALEGEQDDLEYRHISVRSELTAQSVHVIPDACSLLLSNLVRNSVKYTPDSSEIEVFTGIGPDNHPMFRLRDEGPGLKAFPAHFDFEGGPTSARRGELIQETTGGLGLGLIQVFRIARFHGMKVLIDDRPGRSGLEVRVLFAKTPEHVFDAWDDVSQYRGDDVE